MTRRDSSGAGEPTADLRVVVAGAGAIGRAVADALREGRVPGAALAAVLRSGSSETEVVEALAGCDLVVEASTVEAARVVVRRAVRAGRDVVVCSCGVLAEPGAETLLGGPGRVLLPAGALGGFEVLAAAARAGTEGARLRHTTVKRPGALGLADDVTEPVEVFRGTAREAALAYPRTSNSSVALALATLGLDRVEVVVVADPGATATRHVVQWESPVGRYDLTFTNAVDAASGGRTSAITAWSVVELLAGVARGVGPGAVVVPPQPAPAA